MNLKTFQVQLNFYTNDEALHPLSPYLNFHCNVILRRKTKNDRNLPTKKNINCCHFILFIVKCPKKKTENARKGQTF